MKEHMIGFHRWMLKHDTADNAEAYFHYTDEDMVEEYFKEYFKADTSREDYWGPGWRDISKPLEASTQDPAICNYSGLRPVEGYREEKTDEEVMKEGEIMRIKMYEYDEEKAKELNERIIDTEEERNDKIDRLIIDAYWAGYREGQYSGDKTAEEYYREIEETEEYKAYRRGYMDGYDEGLYDRTVK